MVLSLFKWEDLWQIDGLISLKWANFLRLLKIVIFLQNLNVFNAGFPQLDDEAPVWLGEESQMQRLQDFTNPADANAQPRQKRQFNLGKFFCNFLRKNTLKVTAIYLCSFKISDSRPWQKRCLKPNKMLRTLSKTMIETLSKYPPHPTQKKFTLTEQMKTWEQI